MKPHPLQTKQNQTVYSMWNKQPVNIPCSFKTSTLFSVKLCFYHSSMIPRIQKAFHNSIADLPQIWCKFNKTKNFTALDTHRWHGSSHPNFVQSSRRDRPPRQSVRIFFLSPSPAHIQHTKHSPTPYANIFQLEMSNVQATSSKGAFPNKFQLFSSFPSM